VISGAQSADSGTLTLAGRPLSGPPSRRARAGLARTFQHPHLALELSVGENLLLGRAAVRQRSVWSMAGAVVGGIVRPRPAADERAMLALADEVNLSGLDRMARDLSLGEQRLVEVGRALGQDP